MSEEAKREYEISFILLPNLKDEEVNSFGEDTRKTIENMGGVFKNQEKPEKRKLAYPIKKFEFGISDNKIIIIDELLTPDSSRFWPKEQYSPGKAQPSFDKQFVRDYLESLGWDKKPPAPTLPAEIIEKTTQKYLDAYNRLTGKSPL